MIIFGKEGSIHPSTGDDVVELLIPESTQRPQGKSCPTWAPCKIRHIHIGRISQAHIYALEVHQRYRLTNIALSLVRRTDLGSRQRWVFVSDSRQLTPTSPQVAEIQPPCSDFHHDSGFGVAGMLSAINVSYRYRGTRYKPCAVAASTHGIFNQGRLARQLASSRYIACPHMAWLRVHDVFPHAGRQAVRYRAHDTTTMPSWTDGMARAAVLGLGGWRAEPCASPSRLPGSRHSLAWVGEG